MEPFAGYLLKSVIWLTGFALVYFLFLRNERYFLLKRYFLLAGIIFSVIFPLFTFHFQIEMPVQEIPSGDLNGALPGVPVTYSEGTSGSMSELSRALLLLYLAGLLFFTLKTAWNLVTVFKTIYRTKADNLDSVRLIRSSDFSGSFSFFNYVFINPSIDKQESGIIMDHELVHVNQKHWFDLLLIELLRLFQWINPFVWIYSGFIRQNHEYLADKMALQRTSDPAIYKAVLVNQLFGINVFSLSNSFNYSVNKKRFDMMKNIVTSPYRKMKVLLVLPVCAVVFYAFATPEYHYNAEPSAELTIPEASALLQKSVKGVVLNEEGKPMEGVTITGTGSTGTPFFANTDKDGRFEVLNVQTDASLIFMYKGYKQQIQKADFAADLTVKMVRDPEFRQGVDRPAAEKPQTLIVVDGVIAEKAPSPDEIGVFKFLKKEEAVAKYGEKAKDGAVEITTKKRAAELGIKLPFKRTNPEDFPTFQGQHRNAFIEWVTSHAKYPADAQARKSEGWITVRFTVEGDGSITNINVPSSSADKLLGEEIARVIGTSPKWDPAKNPEATGPFTTGVNVKFSLPDRITSFDDPFVVVEEMPMYPGGEMELLKFIAENTRYPEAARAEKAEGKVIARFAVNTEGNAEAVSVLKGVHPLLDAEAMRVVSLLKGFKPGMQGGKPVSVWYMVPINFSLPQEK